ncbi:MAG TPA: hypothetical protein PKV72_02980 [Candidatus Peribacteria bacterium]|nr:hypothetical protein [Candidatus Peribacteria bacterium]
MTNFVSRAKQNRLLRPVFAAAASALVLAGCNTAATTPSTTMDSSSSSADAMMDYSSSSSSADAMMPASSSSSLAAMMQSDVYKDGTYSADGTYRSPAGGESVSVSLTLKDDVVTDATFTGDATNPKSKMMQANFASGFKEVVVGKKLDDVSVTVVNGSSLTGDGFMNALAKIKAEAKA